MNKLFEHFEINLRYADYAIHFITWQIHIDCSLSWVAKEIYCCLKLLLSCSRSRFNISAHKHLFCIKVVFTSHRKNELNSFKFKLHIFDIDALRNRMLVQIEAEFIREERLGHLANQYKVLGRVLILPDSLTYWIISLRLSYHHI